MDPTEAEEEDSVWHTIAVPSHMELLSVQKESGTHGYIYTLWEIDHHQPCWVSQSVPAIVSAINNKVVTTREKRLHASSVYRVLRGESCKQSHKNHRVAKFSRQSLKELNAHLQTFVSCMFVTKTPEKWRVLLLPEPSEQTPDDQVAVSEERATHETTPETAAEKNHPDADADSH